MAAYKAFREPYLISEPLDEGDFADFEARKLRYALMWAFFENTAYRNVHSWAGTYRRQYGLYRYVRGIYNPAYRLSTFWQMHLMGGLLDDEAGDGDGEPSALPILTENEALRPMIANLWQVSNWQVKKDVYTLLGAMWGDIGLEVVDDTERGMVYLRVVKPSLLKDVQKDHRGHVKGYTLEEERAHPDHPNRIVTYREECSREGQAVVYRTFLNDAPYAWQEDDRGQRVAEWTQPWGFVPLAVVQHIDVGLEWGWGEMHAGRSKFHEVDDLASKLSDQVRKAVDAKWFFSGVDKPGSTPRFQSRDQETYQTSSSAVDRPEPGREEIGALYGPEGARAEALVYPLNIADTLKYVNDLLSELERDYPELQMDIWTAGGDASGRALRVARQRTEAKVRQRRVAYDDALVRAQQMALSIGGWRGYEGYSGVDLESYGRGDLDHTIGRRPVFAADPLDDIEVTREFYLASKEAVAAGVPLRFFLEDQGWSEDRLERFDEAQEVATYGGQAPSPPWQPEEEPVEEEPEE